MTAPDAPAPDDVVIALHGVTKQYPDGTVAVHSLDLVVRRGEICVLVGPSGCGKTTTLRMINRLVEPTSGRLEVQGEDVTRADVTALRRRIGYVIQAAGLFPHWTVRRNVATTCRLLGWDRARTEARIDEVLGLVGLDPEQYGDRYPHQLSGGQQQRVGVARALAADPPVLLMDEPFGAVDPIARDRLQAEFHALQRRLGTTVVMVTHDLDEAVRLGDRIAVLRQGGFLEQYDTPARVLAAPATPFVADFVGADRLITLMAVTGIDAGALPAAGPDDAGLPEVGSGATLREAMVVLLGSPEGRVRVAGPAGPVVLGLADVHRLLAQPG
ncbi:MAG: ATP-binding cassette domain-containing protein [Candidatus Nanopelagicales bacterium]|nr:ATP-binding cassette domain-containing protein [Candidatus Nanopelagicales bacterium]